MPDDPVHMYGRPRCGVCKSSNNAPCRGKFGAEHRIRFATQRGDIFEFYVPCQSGTKSEVDLVREAQELMRNKAPRRGMRKVYRV